MPTIDDVLLAIDKFDTKNDTAHAGITAKLDALTITQARHDERLKVVEVTCKDNDCTVESFKPMVGHVKLIYAGLGLIITACAGFVAAALKGWITFGGGT